MIDSRTEDVGCARLFFQITGRFFVWKGGAVMECSIYFPDNRRKASDFLPWKGIRISDSEPSG